MLGVIPILLRLYNTAQSIKSARVSGRSSKLAPPTPSPPSECAPPPPGIQVGGGHTLAYGKGVGGAN
jgi:hypothetical protein